jgi:hypothetical protein
MTETTNTPIAEQPENRFAIPVRYGLITGFVSMFLTTVSFLYVLKMSFIAFGIAGFLMFLVPVILYGVAGARQRKAMGGYISIKDAFQAIFVVILISQLISAVYGLIYVKYIDPECMERMKESALAFFEKMKMPQASIDEQMKGIEEQVDGSLAPAKLLYSFAKSIVIHSIFGLICALIVKKQRPAQQF